MENGKMPLGWIETTLGEICTPTQYGWTTKSSSTGKIKYLRTTDISKDELNWESVPYCLEEPDELEKYELQENDIVVSRAGSIGLSFRMTDVPVKAVFASYLIRFKPIGVHPRFVEFYLQTAAYWSAISEMAVGIAIQNVNATKLSALKIPLPPFAEQTRIVAEIETVLAWVEKAQAELDKIPALLKAFRQKVLAMAVSGELTADFRGNTEGGETAVDLILKRNIFQIDEEIIKTYEIPTTWQWVAIGNYADCKRGKFSARPRNDPQFFGGEHSFIQIGDLPKQGGFVESHVQTLNDSGLKISKKFPKNTVVIAIVGATIGNTGILSYDMCFTDSLIGISRGDEISNFYIDFYLRSIKGDIRQASYSSGGQPNIKAEIINSLPFPLPPLAEQTEIVRRVEELFAWTDELEAHYTEGSSKLKQMPQTLLQKAFTGALVPQDPTDASASVLLEQIRLEKERLLALGKGRKKRQ